MRKTFDYWMVSQAQAQLAVEDTGNTCLRVLGGSVNNSGGYFLIIRTNDVGITKVLTYGPVVEDSDNPINFCSCTYRRLEYDGYKISKIIKDFLRDTRAFQAEEVSFEEVKDYLKNLADLIV